MNFQLIIGIFFSLIIVLYLFNLLTELIAFELNNEHPSAALYTIVHAAEV